MSSMKRDTRLQFSREALTAVLSELGWSGVRLADEMGIDRGYVYHVLNGTKGPGQKFFLGLASVGIDLNRVMVERVTA